MAKKYVVDLNKDEKAESVALTQKGHSDTRKIKRANILLLAHAARRRMSLPKALSAPRRG